MKRSGGRVGKSDTTLHKTTPMHKQTEHCTQHNSEADHGPWWFNLSSNIVWLFCKNVGANAGLFLQLFDMVSQRDEIEGEREQIKKGKWKSECK